MPYWDKWDGYEVPPGIRQALNSQSSDSKGLVKRGLINMGFEDMDKTGESRRVILTHPETPEVVYKVAPGRTKWQNEREWNLFTNGEASSTDERMPDSLRPHLAPVVDTNDEGEDFYWIAMVRADTDNITKEDGKELWNRIIHEHWGIEDLHLNNIGIIHKKPVVIDYVYLKPIDDMLASPKRRWKEGTRWH